MTTYTLYITYKHTSVYMHKELYTHAHQSVPERLLKYALQLVN